MRTSARLGFVAFFWVASLGGAFAASPDPIAKPVSFEGWQQVLRQQRGNVVVIDYWASWCTSCLERFPAMVVMSESMADQPVTFLSLLLEAPNDQDAIAWSQAFLHKQKAPFKHYRMDENLMQAMAKLDLIAIPVVEILGVDGETARKLTNDDPNQQFTEDDVRNTVLALLAELEERESTN